MEYINVFLLPNRNLKRLNIEGNQLAGLPSTALSLPLNQLLSGDNYMHPLLWHENTRNQPQVKQVQLARHTHQNRWILCVAPTISFAVDVLHINFIGYHFSGEYWCHHVLDKIESHIRTPYDLELYLTITSSLSLSLPLLAVYGYTQYIICTLQATKEWKWQRLDT